MAKLTKQQIKDHCAACDLLRKDHLDWDERVFVLENWREDAEHMNSAAGAFFTPFELAQTFSVEVSWGGPGSARILDLCAGIGALSFHLYGGWGQQPEVTCVELNPAYAEVGRKVVPDARWIVGNAFEVTGELGNFDFVIGNPPFGRIKHAGAALRYTGSQFEYQIIDLASDLGDYGVFIIPQMSAPFRYSGAQSYRREESEAYQKFRDQTAVELGASCGINTDFARDLWRGTSPKTEVVVCDFTEARAARKAAQADLFGEAA